MQDLTRSFHKFRQFNVEPVVSSPHYPQSNGHVESAVKSMKQLTAKTTANGDIDNDDFSNGVLEYRNTSGKTGYIFPSRNTIWPSSQINCTR